MEDSNGKNTDVFTVSESAGAVFARVYGQLVRTFSVFQEQINTPGESRATGLTLTNLQSDDSGLEAGAVFQHGGILRIPVTNSPFVRGSVGTSAVGSVTVTTS